MSAHFSPIMIEGALVLPATMRGHDRGVGDAQPARCRAPGAADRPPRRRSRPMRQVPTGCRLETPLARMSALQARPRSVTLGARQDLLDDEGLQRRLPGDLAADAHAVDHARSQSLALFRKLKRISGARQRIGRFQPHRAAAVGPEMHRAEAEGREGLRHHAVAVPLLDRPGEHVDLQVRPLQPLVAAHQRADDRGPCWRAARCGRSAYCAPAMMRRGRLLTRSFMVTGWAQRRRRRC